MKLYVGNLSHSLTEDELKGIFTSYGPLTSAVIIKDRTNQDSKGFGFVEFENSADGMNAMKELNSKEIKGRSMVVNEAKPKTENTSGYGSGKRRW